MNQKAIMARWQRISPTIMLLFLLIPLTLWAQTFSKVTDAANDIANTIFGSGYSGAAWIDYDNDGDMDLFTTNSFLFRNDQNGVFVKVETVLGEDQVGSGIGTSWADYDNDGDLDCFISSQNSLLYRNDANGVFTPLPYGEFDPENDNRGWACAWGDYNNDGYVDLIITHPAGFVGAQPTGSHFFISNGGGSFTRDLSSEFTIETAPYTVASWTDFDLDNDLDLFIGSGPAIGGSARDYLYKNLLQETETASLERIEEGVLATDNQDGQVWNLIDYDNDGDLDAFVTNYAGAPDRFYRNENGTYVSLSNALTIGGSHLANTWGDLDNDTDLDVVVTSESGNFYYRNEGDGTFSSVENAITLEGGSRGAVLADYDDDGFLDVFISGTGDAAGLYHNDTDNGNNWILISCEGTVSNRAAIGAKLKLKATIGDTSIWQQREILAQNSFNGHNSLRVHFGLAEAVTADSLVIDWPSGARQIAIDLVSNGFYAFVEEIPTGYLRADFSAEMPERLGTPHEIQFRDISVVDSNMPISSWEWDFNGDEVVDATSQEPVWTFDSLGTFSVTLSVSNGVDNDVQTKMAYVRIQRKPGFPIITALSPAFTDTTVGKSGSVSFEVTAIDTSEYPISYEWTKNGTAVTTANFYNYRSTAFEPAPRTDTVTVTISNGFNTTARSWYVHVEDLSGLEAALQKPHTYSLAQNYPNPFNPTTMIQFSIAESGFVSLKIFNLLGEQVESLVSKHLGAGIYDYTYKANHLAAGIYYYRLQTADFSATRKFVLLK